MDISEGYSRDEKDEDVPEVVILAKNGFSEIFHKIESTKDKMWEADPNLERSVIICQGIEKMLA